MALKEMDVCIVKTIIITIGTTYIDLVSIFICLFVFLRKYHCGYLPVMISLTNHRLVTIVPSINIPTTNIIRFGPAGFMGTVALFRVVKAGVRSCSFAFMASSCVHMAV